LTENEFRDNAIHSFILDTDAYEYITFMPTKLSGIPEIFEADKPISITIEGELTIRDITQSVIFSGTVTVKGRSQLSGSASAHINRSDFQLQIPDAPGVAKVSEEVSLIIHFVALPVQ
jgi:polyisoprenoid-binding protein YceI